MEAVLFVLFALSEMLLVFLILLFSRRFSQNFALFMLLAVWAAHTKYVPIGNIHIFKPMITHEFIALILGLAVLILIFKERYIGSAFFLTVCIFVHSLMALHLFLIVAPVLVLKLRSERRLIKKYLFCGILLTVGALIYLNFMTPPFLTSQEAVLFMLEKGDCMHVSPLNQSVLGWIHMLGLSLMAWLVSTIYFIENKNLQMMRSFVAAGFIVGLLLSFAAILTKLPFLALLQPMRIFVWVFFLANVLIAAAAVLIFEKNIPLSLILLAVLIFNILNSQWSVVFILVGLLYIAGDIIRSFVGGFIPLFWEAVVRVFLIIGMVLVFAAWLPVVNHSVESFKQPYTLFPALVLALIAAKIIPIKAYKPALYILIIYSFAAASYFHHRHDFFSAQIDSEWDKAQIWCRENTDMNDRFITPPEGDNFRILSLRTTLSEDMPALVWIDPFEYQINHIRVEEVLKGYSGGLWDLNFLFSLADKWKAAYVIVNHSYIPEDQKPVYRSGAYSIFSVENRDK